MSNVASLSLMYAPHGRYFLSKRFPLSGVVTLAFVSTSLGSVRYASLFEVRFSSSRVVFGPFHLLHKRGSRLERGGEVVVASVGEVRHLTIISTLS